MFSYALSEVEREYIIQSQNPVASSRAAKYPTVFVAAGDFRLNFRFLHKYHSIQEPKHDVQTIQPKKTRPGATLDSPLPKRQKHQDDLIGPKTRADWVREDVRAVGLMDHNKVVVSLSRLSGSASDSNASWSSTMRYRGIRGGKEWAKCRRWEGKALLLSVPRQQCSSRALFGRRDINSPNTTRLDHLTKVLDSLPAATDVDLLVRGIDGFTTIPENFIWIHEKWGETLNIQFVFLIPQNCTISQRLFPTDARNGLRYGAFKLTALVGVVNESFAGNARQEERQDCEDLLQILRTLTDSEAKGKPLCC